MNSVAIVHTQCGPYHLARIRALVSTYPGKVDLIQLATQESQRQWVVDNHSVKVTTIAEGVLEAYAARNLIKGLLEHLTQTRPSVLVVAGYSQPAMRAAIKWSSRNRIPVILLSDSQGCDRPRNPLTETLKGQWIRRHCDAAFVAGGSAAQYLENLSFPKHRVWRGYDVIDNRYFSRAAHIIQQNKTHEREALGLPERFFLYVGRFSREKNLLRLIEAFSLYQSTYTSEPWTLVLVGSGEQELILKDKARKLGLKNIAWPGFKQIDELPAYYSLASALILPSTSEPWGLVINEAMACGLPILASTQCGAIFDLVFPGINGAVFNPWDSSSISQVMASFSQNSVDRQAAMGRASQRIIRNFTPESWATALTDCIIQTGRSVETSSKVLM